MKYKLTEDEYNLATFYSECRKFTKNDVEKMKLLLRTHLDPKINICSHCKAQVAYAQRKVIYLLENSVVKRECNICKMILVICIIIQNIVVMNVEIKNNLKI